MTRYIILPPRGFSALSPAEDPISSGGIDWCSVRDREYGYIWEASLGADLAVCIFGGETQDSE